jgi:hypothetical protein
MSTDWHLEDIRATYRDPQRFIARSGPKLGADLLVVAIATLDEVARLRELLEGALPKPARRRGRASAGDARAAR